MKQNTTKDLNEVRIKFRFYKQSSNLEKNEFNIPTSIILKSLLLIGYSLLHKTADRPLQALPLWHSLMCFNTFFIVWQWGSKQLDWDACWPGVVGTPCSRRWHLWACNSNTSCCWMSRRFSGSAVADCGAAVTTDCWEPPGNWCCVAAVGTNTCCTYTVHFTTSYSTIGWHDRSRTILNSKLTMLELLNIY